ncbi:supervillin [Diachasma alloeum]|uniref:supervillin n=1 Tax=Diachasma alloeum TaxID=454923 RepID=UPI0007382EF5|nr:supervillin [Diachasma alloeum]
MVAAGATALMAAGDSGTSKTADNGVQEGQLSGEGERRRTSAFATRRKDSSITPNKTASIRETKTSRLRAASIVSPTDTSTVRKPGLSETVPTSRSSPHTSSSNLSTTQRTTRASGIPQTFSRERERHRQASSRGADVHEKLMEASAGERLSTRRSKKPSKPSTTTPPTPKPSRPPFAGHSTPSRPSSIPTSLRASPHSPSFTSAEVLQRVDALTALTRATMERVERLASSSPHSSVPLPTPRDPGVKLSPRAAAKRPTDDSKSSPNQNHHPLPPVSILKHKTSDPPEPETVSNPLPTVAFNLSDSQNNNPASTKKHGILKKRSSLDESEILRRNSSSPDSILVSPDCPSPPDTDFRSILKYERRSSLDELVKRPSIEHNPPSILKNRWSRSNDEEDQTSERQGILKKHPQSIADAVAKSLGVTWTELESVDRKSAEVRPILKKKLSHDESSSSDPPSLEPRPILKKKSSTDSDEHDDRPRKTILKYSSRKNSEDSSHECETAPNSPKKLSVLKQHSLQRRTNSLPECDTLTVKPILKNSRSRSIQSTSSSPSRELFMRKRARSVGHEQTDGKDWLDPWEGIRREGCGGDSGGTDIESDPVVTFEFPEDSKPNDNPRLGFSSEEAAVRRLDDYSAKVRRDKRVSRRFRDRREMSQLSSIRRDGGDEGSKTVVVGFEGGAGRGEGSGESPRFCTQPVTCQEVREAADLIKGENGLGGSGRDLGDPGDPSKLSIAQRVALFNRKIATESAERAGLCVERGQRRAFSRFRTQPVTSEEVEDAARHVPNPLVTDGDGRQTPGRLLNVKNHDTPKSILKSSSSYTVCNLSHRSSSKKLDLRTDLSQELAEISVNVSTSAETYSDTMKRYIGCTVPSYDYTDNKIDKNCGYNEKIIDSVSCDKGSRGKTVSDPLDNRSFKGIGTTQSLDFPGVSIADRLAALKRSGSTDWKRRVISESLPPSIVVERPMENDKADVKSDICQKEREECVISQKKLADRLEKLESAAEGWRKRVATADAVKFSVAGKMKFDQIDTISHNSKPVFESMGNCSGVERKKKTPHKRDDARRGVPDIVVGGDSSDAGDRKISRVLTYNNGDLETHETSIQHIPNPADETFTAFFDGISFEKSQEETIAITESDFDFITPSSEKLCSRKTTQVQRRKVSTHHNPLKALAARTDLKSEYTEVKTGVAERLMKLKNLEKLGKNSSLAVEALAGLASTESFTSISLKATDDSSNGFTKFHPKDSHLFLVLIKGRRHVQVRLVEPSISSLNSGDNFILVSKAEIYHYIGKYSNVIEKSRATEIALSIQQHKDLGCKAPRVVTLDEQKCLNTSEKTLTSDFQRFFSLLGHSSSSPPDVADAGHPDEDEQYESALIDTNVVYDVSNNELIPLEKYWGAIPKIKMLDPSKILIFDFGSELYIWNGKCAPVESRRSSLKLAEALWGEGYDYSDCAISPVDAARMIGRRTGADGGSRKGRRPGWCLSAKLTQHMETVLFREKFLDWPNSYGIIKCRKPPEEKDKVDGKIVIAPPELSAMMKPPIPRVDLVLEGCHLGRGTGWSDAEFSREYLVTTREVTVWHIDEHSYSKLEAASAGQFFSGDSYIIRWMYLITVTGRELSGQPSKHAVEGRDRCAYFIWQGKNASLNKQGTAALLTVELDKEQGPQVRIVEGFEPPAFLNLFRGAMVIHTGKRAEQSWGEGVRAFFCRGSREGETSLLEVPFSSRQLRTRGCLLFVDGREGVVYVWYGRNCLSRGKQNAFHAAEALRERKPLEMGLEGKEVRVVEIEEGEEPEDLFGGGMHRKLYGTISRKVSRHTPRMFHFSSVSGEFSVAEVLCPQRDEENTAFPFLQEELYQASQPALFLLDNGEELWLWQGWWPNTGEEDQTGSGAVRWQAERRAAMTAAVEYWGEGRGGKSSAIYLVWAGLEPLEFINLFPTWGNRDDIAELNMKDGRGPGEMLSLENELTRLTQSTYPPAQLLQRPLPEGVDPTSLELYLSPAHFQELLGMSMEDFQKLPSWKQIEIKKKIGLF